jgi:hypothetical protein
VNRFAFATTVLTVSSMLSACAPMRSMGIPDPGDPKPAGAVKEHMIVVTVVNKEVRADVPDLQLWGNGHKITWYLDNSMGEDYQFASDSINLQSVSNQRYQCRRQGKYHFRCDDTASGSGKYKYDIAVQQAKTLDPLVVNN